MKYLSILFLLFCSCAYILAEEVWVGVYVIEHAEKRTGYWLGSFDKDDYDALVKGTKTTGFMVLKSVCYWESKEQGEQVKWFLMEQKDEVELGQLVIRPDKIDRMFVLDGDPRKKVIYKDKDGNKISKENW